MEDNNKPLNPIARARQQANINKSETHGINPGDIDLFGNTEPIKHDPIENNSTFSDPVFNDFEEETTEPYVVAEEEKVYTIGGEGIEENFTAPTPAPKSDVIIQPINKVEPVITQEPEETDQPVSPLVFDPDKVLEKEPVKEETTVEISTQVEEPKQKKEKPVRIIKENETVITPESIKEGRKIAWLAYILFFIPLLMNKTNAYVRHNANEGLEIFIFDVLAGILLLLNAVVNVDSFLVSGIFLIGGLVAWVLLILTTITKIYMIFVALCGKVAQTPWCWKFRIIK